eukprot:Skav224346  [mRNA]  locus=scaffold2411:209127:210892:- [translate_table: standard]
MDWVKAQVLLDDMARCQVISNEVTLNTCARAYRLAGQWRQVLGLWNQGHQADLISLTLMAGASEQGNRWDLALQFLDLAAGMQPDLMFYNTVMSACVAADQWRGVLHLLGARASKDSLSTVSFNLTITAVSEGTGGWRLALKLLDFTRTSWCSPDLYSFNGCLGACASQAWRNAVALLGRSWQPDVVTYGVLAKMEAWQLASLALGRAKERKGQLQLSIVSFNSAISACGKALQWLRAMDLLREALRRRIQSNDLTYGATIAAVAEADAWQLAMLLLDEMVSWRSSRDLPFSGRPKTHLNMFYTC